MSIVRISSKSTKPKYKQIVVSIEEAIESGRLKKGDQLPSLNAIKQRHSVSRDTVLMAFNELKTRGIIESAVGKGYFVLSEAVSVKQKVFLLFDELNGFKEELYNAFVKALQNNARVDIFFHHFNSKVFASLITENAGAYTQYVIMPANLKDTQKVIGILPQDRVYILDQHPEELRHYPGISQNFKKDVFEGLTAAIDLLKKYQQLVLVDSSDRQPRDLIEGFEMFCKMHHKSYEIVSGFQSEFLKRGSLYLILEDRDLIRFIKMAKDQSLTLAKDIGVISYNDTILKEIVGEGIATISTDFKHMGKRLAEMINANEKQQIENPNRFILRTSL